MSWNSVQHYLNWSSKHLNEAITDPEIKADVANKAGVDVESSAMSPDAAMVPSGMAPSMSGLQAAAGAALQGAGSYGAQQAATQKKVAGRY
jgi:hypothetical protein